MSTGSVVPGSGTRLSPERRAELAAEYARDNALYDTDPVQSAREAAERGDRYLEIEMEVRDASGADPWFGHGEQGTERAERGRRDGRVRRARILGEVEDLGWSLVNTDYVYVQLGESSRDRLAHYAQNTAVRGKVVAYYLFRRT